MTRIIIFEGPDGVGKTTQAKILYKVLSAMGYRTKIYHQPSDFYRAKLYSNDIPEMSKIMYALVDYTEKLKEIMENENDLDIVIMDRTPFMSVLAYNTQHVYDDYKDINPHELIESWIKLYSRYFAPEDIYLVFDLVNPFVMPSAERDGVFAEYDHEYIDTFYQSVDTEYLGVKAIRMYGGTDLILDKNMTEQETAMQIIATLRNEGIL